MTYAQQYVDGTFVYGYDTAHIDMEAVKYKDGFWHRMQVEFMVDAIIIARRLEKRYRRAQTNTRKATVLDELNRRLYLRSVQVGRGKQGIEIMGNTGVMLKLLAGDL